jgi:hypothetical protein
MRKTFNRNSSITFDEFVRHWNSLKISGSRDLAVQKTSND